MNYDFEPFTEKNTRTRFSSGPELRMQKGARFVLNSVAHQLIGAPEYVELLRTRHGHVIGIKAASEAARARGYAYKLRHPDNSSLYSFSSRRFAEIISEHDKQLEGRFAATVDKDILVVDLDQQASEGGRSQ